MVSWSSSGGLRVDLGDAARFLVEQLRVHRRPATEIGEPPQLLRCRELVAYLGGDRGVGRAESSSRPDLLGFRCVLEVLERDGGVQVGAGSHDGYRVLDLDGLRRVDVSDRLS